MDFIYLHGFASGPNSAKAQFLRDRFSQLQRGLETPDLNQGDFTHLTLTRQIQQVRALLPTSPVTLIGSSLGGLTSAWVAEHSPQVERLVLLAPAFDFLSHWLPRIGVDQLQQWQTNGSLPVYHYATQQKIPLQYEFLVDAGRYPDAALQRPVPTLILHGTADEVIPVQSSREYAASRPWVTLIELASDHALTNVLPEIWDTIQQFCALSTPTELPLTS